MTHKYLPYQLALIYLVNKRKVFIRFVQEDSYYFDYSSKNTYCYYNQKHISDLTFKNHKLLNQVLKQKYLSTLNK